MQKKKLIYIMDDLSVRIFSVYFHFCLNYSFKHYIKTMVPEYFLVQSESDDWVENYGHHGAIYTCLMLQNSHYDWFSPDIRQQFAASHVMYGSIITAVALTQLKTSKFQ